MDILPFIILTGIGATVAFDIWGYLRAPLFAMAAPNYGLVGRWIAHMSNGRFTHQSIRQSDKIRGEHLIGWVAHYAIGIIFAAIPVLFLGVDWIEKPSLVPALGTGIATLAAPFLIMQPAMGAGFASSKVSNPTSARLHSLIGHSVFGIGLYGSAILVNRIFQ